MAAENGLSQAAAVASGFLNARAIELWRPWNSSAVCLVGDGDVEAAGLGGGGDTSLRGGGDGIRFASFEGCRGICRCWRMSAFCGHALRERLRFLG